MNRLLPAVFATMVALLTLGLAGAFALGFGVAVPQPLVLAAIGGGTIAMAATFAILITLRIRAERAATLPETPR